MARTFTWDGVKLPMPNLNYGLADISTSDSGRTLSARMEKKEVAKKVTLDCSWEMLTDSECSKIIKTIKPKTYGDCNYPDVMEGNNVTKTFYSGDVNCELKYIDGDICSWNIDLSIIEQ
ncbi:MAG: hypothetical protein RR579_06355 [Eubacterium sp.]